MKRHTTWDTWLTAFLSLVLVGLVGCAFWVNLDPGDADPGREAFMDGAYASWEVITECERGSDPCSVVLDRYNSELRPRGMRIFEDGSVSVIGK